MPTDAKDIQVIQAIRLAVADNQLSDAFVLLQTHFDGQKKYDHLANLRRSVQADYSRLRSDEISRTRSHAEFELAYAQINSRILQIVQKIEDQDLAKPVVRLAGMPKNYLVMGSFGLALLAIVVLAWQFWPKPTVDTMVCPQFDDKARFTVMVLPFDRLGGEELFPEKQVRNELNELSASTGVSVSAVAVEKGAFDVQTLEEASLLGERCAANMVIWGSYEKTSTGLIVNLRYRLVGKEYQTLQKLKISGDSGLRIINTVSGIQSGGELLHDIESAIRQVFGLAAFYNKDFALALAAWDKNTHADTAMILLGADALLSLGKTDSALLMLNMYIDSGGTNSTALNNRGMLRCKQGDVAGAVADLQRARTANPRDTILLKNSIYAFELNGQLAEAREAITAFEENWPQDAWVVKHKTVIDAALKTEVSRLATSTKQLVADPDNQGALAAKAKSNWKLGKVREATAQAQQLIVESPKSPKGHQLLAQIYESTGQEEKAKKILETATRRGIDISLPVVAPKLKLLPAVADSIK